MCQSEQVISSSIPVNFSKGDLQFSSNDNSLWLLAVARVVNGHSAALITLGHLLLACRMRVLAPYARVLFLASARPFW